MQHSKLFDLIQSLSMSEKRFFKVFSSRHVLGESNDYVRLFDLIEGMDEYDEYLVRDADFVKNSSAEKNYLYRLILKSLNSYHAQHGLRTKVYDYLISIEILFQKGLYGQALGLVKKARQITAKNEMFRQELVLAEMEEELLLKGQNYTDAQEIIEADGILLDHIENIKKLKFITTKGYAANLSKGVIRDGRELDSLGDLINNSLVTDSELAYSERALLYQISAQLTYHMIAGNNGEVLHFVEKILKQYEKHNFLISLSPIGYVSSLFIQGNALYTAKKYEDLNVVIEKINKARTFDSVKKSQKATAGAFVYRYILTLKLVHRSGDKNDILTIVQTVSQELSIHVAFVATPQLYDLYFYMARAYFLAKEYKQALHYTNMVINDTKFKSRADFLNTLWLFNLLIHYELGNDFTLEYLSKSTMGYLKRKDRLYKVERLVVNFIRKVDRYRSSQTEYVELNRLHQELLQCKKDQFEQKAFQYFDYELWAADKVVVRD